MLFVVSFALLKNNISQLINCNLNIYKLAIAKASEEGAQLIVLPEAYGITDTPTKKDHDEYCQILKWILYFVN